MVGLLGNGGIYPPLLVYVSRWFDRRRGTAIALISSGQYIAGVVWPALFERGIRARLAAGHAGYAADRAGRDPARHLAAEARAAAACRSTRVRRPGAAIASPACIPTSCRR